MKRKTLLVVLGLATLFATACSSPTAPRLPPTDEPGEPGDKPPPGVALRPAASPAWLA